MDQLEGFDQYVQDAMQSWHCPGLAMVVIKGDEIVHQSVYGLRDVEEQLPMTADTRFPIASITKSFTAMTVALLVDEGKLEWDKPVRETMPEFILDDPYVTQHVTVRDMLTHRTGLPRHDLAAWRLDLPLAEFIKRMRYLKFGTSFRQNFQYNNLMYSATAYLVEKITGQRWADFVQERIFTPLGMTASSCAPEPPLAGQVTAAGYRTDYDEAGDFKGLVHMPFGKHTELSPGAAGTLFSSLADLTQWLKVHVNAGCLGDFQLVSLTNLQQMHLPQIVMPGGGVAEALTGTTISTYGMGWAINPYREYTLIQHGGGVEGHTLMVGFVPQENIGVVVLTNISSSPLPELLMYESIDRTLGLTARDWNTRFHGVYDPLIAAQSKGKQTAAAERVEDAPPTHPLEAYVGVYEAKGYPDFAVRFKDEHMQACTVGSLEWSELRHYHYNVFEWYFADFDFWSKVRFLVNDTGEVDSVSIPMEPAVDNIIFTRKQLELPEEIVAALVGEYDPPIDGLAFTITAHEGRIYIAQTGNPPAEIKPYKLTADTVGFKSRQQTRLDFMRENDSITRMVVKMPGMTLEAPRK